MKTMDVFDVKNALSSTGAVLEGHFELSSGFHTNKYFQCAKLLQYPNLAEETGKAIAAKINFPVDVVIGPALGGVIIAYEVARALGKKGLFVERKDGELQLRRGFEIAKGEKVLIVEDVITTAKSAKEATAVIDEYGGTIAGYACIIDRSEGNSGLEIVSLAQMSVELYSVENCPLCLRGNPVIKPGSRPSGY